MINSPLLEPMQDYMPLSCLPPFENNSELLTVSPSEVCNSLLELNPRKAGGPDGINNWLLRDFADFLTSPVCRRHTSDESKASDYHRQAYPTYLPDTCSVQANRGLCG